MELFPVYYNIENKVFLIVGGGSVALEKLGVLRQFKTQLVLLSEESELFKETDTVYTAIPSKDIIKDTFEAGNIVLVKKSFEPSDVLCADFIIGATNDYGVNRQIAEAAHAEHRMVNVVDTADLCDFTFPAIIKEQDMVITVGTNGKSPAAAAYIKACIKSVLPAHIGDIIAFMGKARKSVSAHISLQKDRKQFYSFILNRMIEGNRIFSEEELLQYLTGDDEIWKN